MADSFDDRLPPGWPRHKKKKTAVPTPRISAIIFNKDLVIVGDETRRHIRIDPSLGLAIKDGQTEKIKLKTNGDVFAGRNLSDPATTFLSLFSVGQTYNGQSVSAGDVLLGDNSTGKHNIWWDLSNGRLHFRSGVISKAFIDTDGLLNAQEANISGDGSGFTNIDGGNIQTGTITATQIAASTITLTELNFTPVETDSVVASINASAEGITINAARLNLTGVLAVGSAAADVNSNTTTIDGGKITPNTITLTQLNFTPVETDSVVASINASAEGITINAARLNLTGVLAVGSAAADVNSNTTTIDGGKITAVSITAAQITANTITATQIAANTITASQIAANTITASQIAANTITANEIAASTITATQLNVSTLSAISANIGTITAGSISGVSFSAGGGVITLNSDGSQIQASTAYSTLRSYQFTISDVEAGGIYARDLSSANWIALRAETITGKTPIAEITAGSVSILLNFDSGRIELECTNLQVNGTLNMEGADINTDNLNAVYNVDAEENIRADGSLVIGSTTFDPDLGSYIGYIFFGSETYRLRRNGTHIEWYNGSTYVQLD